MGLGGIGVWQLLIVLAIVVMLFGTSRLKTIGGDLGSAIKGFRSAIKESDAERDVDDAAADSGSTDVAPTQSTEQGRPT
ncbi:MAG: twin-arginine translocase TatA/TatE family subunit [Pseudomonadota bacterium]